MRIDQINIADITKQSGMTADHGAFPVVSENTDPKIKADPLGGHTPQVKNQTYGKPGQTMAEEIAGVAALGEDMAKARQNEMAVLSNTMTKEDYQEYRENGCSLRGMDSHEILTVVDKIKVQLAKSGEDVGEISLPDEVIRDVGGEAALSAIQNAYAEADLPLTEDNLKETEKALDFAADLTEFSDGAVKVMVTKELTPTIENLTIAKGSAAAETEPPLPEEKISDILPRMEAVAEESGLPFDEEVQEESRWMLSNEIPLTPENLEKVHELKNMELPPKPEEVLAAAVKAVQEGGRPTDADLLSMRRAMEETRVKMTADAARTMEKLGVEVDMKELQEGVDLLKEEEQAFYEAFLKKAEAPVTEETLDLFAETERKIAEIKELPADTLGLREVSLDTLNEIHEAGLELKIRMDRAGEAYETMKTEVRRDLGDSIQKAFRNIDAILEDMELPVTESNERAVRILGYNSIEITEENIAVMKARDAEMQAVFRNLTPPVVADFIKKGENPLDLSLPELNERALAANRELGIPEEEKYSEFLVKLENNGGITEEERESYIGIYRLLHQIEQSDGAAIGALVMEGAEITMRNLMTAIRTAKRGSMDYTVDDSFEGTFSTEKTKNIVLQAETAFHSQMISEAADALSPESLKSAMEGDPMWEQRSPEEFARLLQNADTKAEEEQFLERELREVQQAAHTEEEVYRALERFDLPNTVENVQIMQHMMITPNAAMRKLFGVKNDKYYDENGKADLEKVKEELIKRFGDAASEPEDMAKAQKELADVAENVLKAEMAGGNANTSMDVRELKLMAGQMRLSVKAAERQEYHIPILVQGETGEMTLKIVNGKEKKGMVDISFSLSAIGNVAAKLKIANGKMTGYVAAERQETKEKLEQQKERFSEALAGSEGLSSVSLSFVNTPDLNLRRFAAETDRENDAIERSEETTVTTKALYRAAKSFLNILNDF